MGLLRVVVLFLCTVLAASQIVIGMVYGEKEAGCRQEGEVVIITLHQWWYIDAMALMLAVFVYTYNYFRPRSAALECAVAFISTAVLLLGSLKFWKSCQDVTPIFFYHLTLVSLVWHSLFVIGCFIFVCTVD